MNDKGTLGAQIIVIGPETTTPGTNSLFSRFYTHPYHVDSPDLPVS